MITAQQSYYCFVDLSFTLEFAKSAAWVMKWEIILGGGEMGGRREQYTPTLNHRCSACSAALPKENFLAPPLHLPPTTFPTLLLSTTVIYMLTLAPFLDHKLLSSLSPSQSLAQYLAKKKILKISVERWTMNSSSVSTNSHLFLPAFEITWSSCQQNIVGMPIQAEDGGPNWLFNVFAYPPTKGENPL